QSLLALAVTAALGAGSALAGDKDNEAALAAQAKVSKADAQATALAKVPGGTVKEAEIEKEKGVLIWSFDITTAGTKDITEVNVDATTGKIVNVETESANKKEADDKD
ncbi:MAG TPA: PepSY domain-containing protein, partial [Chthoniobacteraceae bacterium]|nr:PepSY domain-containing protein [Chthoniobacteraceae bacterium]